MRRIDHSAGAIVVLSLVLALAVRVAIVAPSAFPLNDGGLFHAFITDLLDNHLGLPAFSSYNGASIPFAYPPLGFYVVALLSLALHLPLLQLLQYVPAALSLASIPAFYFLAIELLPSRRQAALATLIFSLLPRTFDWLIMGGGITRSLGLLLALLVIRQAFLLFVRRSAAAILPTIILGGLLVVSHPEAAMHTALTAALLYTWSDHSSLGLRRAALVAAGIVVVTAPWWAVVVARHGIEPFVAAAAAARADSHSPLVGLLALLRFDFTDEPFLRVFAVLGLLGLAVRLSRRQFFLPAWFVLLHTVEPRGGTLFMMMPLAMAAGSCLDDIILPALTLDGASQPATRQTASVPAAAWLGQILQGRGQALFLGFLVVYGCLAAYAVGANIQREFTLNTHDQKAFEWVRVHTPLDARFALVTQALPLRDASSDWFPALANRRSIATVFGMEWVRSADFAARIELNSTLQACAHKDTECLKSWAEEQEEPVDYVYLRDDGTDSRTALGESLAISSDFELVYSDEGLAIYAWK
jgi:hypothetical protein